MVTCDGGVREITSGELDACLRRSIYPRGGARAGWGGETRQVDTRHGHTLSSHFLGCRDAKRRMAQSRLYYRLRVTVSRATSAVHEISIHHSQSSQSISIYDREIGAKISVSVSISRFLRLHTLL